VRIGSGYPHDAATRAFMRGAHARRALGEAPLPYVRYSWAMNLPSTPVPTTDATVEMVADAANATVHARVDDKTSAARSQSAATSLAPVVSSPVVSAPVFGDSPPPPPPSAEPASKAELPPSPPPPKPSKAAAPAAQASAMQTTPSPTQPSQPTTVTRTFAPALRRGVGAGASASAGRPFAARVAKSKVAEPPPIDIPADLVQHFERIVME
jgi:hypothetical protein